MKKLTKKILSLSALGLALSASGWANPYYNYTPDETLTGSSPERCVINQIVRTLEWQNEPSFEKKIGFRLSAEQTNFKKTDDEFFWTYRVTGNVSGYFEAKDISAVGDFWIRKTGPKHYECGYTHHLETVVIAPGYSPMEQYSNRAALIVENTDSGRIVIKNPEFSGIR